MEIEVLIGAEFAGLKDLRSALSVVCTLENASGCRSYYCCIVFVYSKLSYNLPRNSLC